MNKLMDNKQEVRYDRNNHYNYDHCLLFEQLYEQSNRHVQIVD